MHQVGDLVRSTAGGWVTLAPAHCPNSHQLGAGQVLVGHAPCSSHRGSHTTWTCRTCDETIYGPELGPDCSVLNGPAAVRNSFRSSNN